ncbi:putative mediator of RNA polymerase II transcription subunit 12 [Toxorhynchites rutilus septentrionalis]|uniref:putative mediator of RNA polymerase II transcription subunit 12 n=1 Tax=Toxorhynchites rutilus septentrionalis TaxID=329112 RepID=UPI0024790AF3|nr:putative mediator of RNA polymerase II transcription subunit 12 [Toxorhynchites rutilus septentrionalis]
MDIIKFQFLVVLITASVVYGDYSPSFKPAINGGYPKLPMAYPSWAAKQSTGSTALKQYMVQLRSGTRMPSGVLRPAPGMIMSMKRPIKSVYGQGYPLNKQPLIKRPHLVQSQSPFMVNLNLKHKFATSPTGPKTGEIVYEKLKPLVQQPTVHLTSSKDGAIHTIPAPNLGSTKNKPVHQLKITTFDDNNNLEIDIHKSTRPAFTTKHSYAPQSTYPALSTQQPSASYPPVSIHQYQVTEEQTNDVTLKDLYSGQKTYFAPDPDPSLPSKSLLPTSDPLSEPSNGKYPPKDLLIQAQTQTQTQFLPQPSTAAFAQKPYYGIVNAAPQSSFSIPLATQPQLQQHILQQTSMLQGMPLSLYNPTYLVTQSNNLFNNHQQQLQANLFKPETSFVGAVPSQPTSTGDVVFNSYTYKHTEPAASAGQILAATQDQLHELQSAVSQIQLNDLNQQSSNDVPTYAQLVGHEQLALHQQQIPQQNQLEQQLQQQLIQQQEKSAHQQLTESEIANLLNYGTINLHNQLSPSDYYHYQVDAEHQQQQQLQKQQQLQQQSFYELSERQKENDEILAQAQHDLYQQHQQQNSYQYNTEAPQQSSASSTTDYLLAYQEHQQAVANALSLSNNGQNSKRATAEPQTTTAPMRIFVPDTDSEYPNSVKAKKRMDELNYEYADDEEAANLFNTEPSTSRASVKQSDSSDDKIKEDINHKSGEYDESEFYRHYSNHRFE